MTNIVMNDQHAGFGMPVSARDRVAPLRSLRMTPVVLLATGEKCALGRSASVTGTLVTDARTTGAFPGPSAWSPPS